VILPTPSGTRDVLPDEMRELRAITEAIRGVFDMHGYGEVWTPALEYEEVLQKSGLAEDRSVYRMFDEHGKVLTLRWDMTVPIARVVATRYATAEPPLRFSYFAHSYRDVRPQRGQPRELLQAGIELVGSPAPDGTAEALTILCRALDAAGLRDYRIGMGDAALYPSLMTAAGVPDQVRADLLDELVTRNFVGLEQRVRGLGLGSDAVELLVAVPQLRGGPEVLERVGELGHADMLRRLHGLLPEDVARRLIFDLGLVRQLGYYTGAVFEVYDPALGAPIGRGGRYDDLLGRFGRDLPAVGFALNVDRLHIALTGEERSR
jgi:ATP phosphoribosyltransferase regulatory subunit